MEEIEKLKEKIATLNNVLATYEAERIRFAHSVPEYSGLFFIAGYDGEVDEHGLPEYIQICPAYGANWTQQYTRTTVRVEEKS